MSRAEKYRGGGQGWTADVAISMERWLQCEVIALICHGGVDLVNSERVVQ